MLYLVACEFGHGCSVFVTQRYLDVIFKLHQIHVCISHFEVLLNICTRSFASCKTHVSKLHGSKISKCIACKTTMYIADRATFEFAIKER